MAVFRKCIHDILSYTNPIPQNMCLIFAWTLNIFPYRHRSPPYWLMVIAADGNCRPPVNVLCVIGAPLFESTLAPRRSIAFRNSAGTWSRAPGKQFGVLDRWRDRHTRPARWSDTLRIRPVRWRKWNRIRIDLARLADPIVSVGSSTGLASRATVPLLRYAPLTWQSGTLVQVSPWTIFIN